MVTSGRLSRAPVSASVEKIITSVKASLDAMSRSSIQMRTTSGTAR
jgi:hypothetical protein